jgi:flagellar motor switch protein FliN
MKKTIIAFLNSYQNDLSQLINQVLNSELTWNHSVDEKLQPAGIIQTAKHPQVALRVSLNAGKLEHLFLLTPDAVLEIYAWMTGAEPDLKVSPEHLDGLKEIANQILGQIQTLTQGTGQKYKVDEINCIVSNVTTDSLNLLPADENGLCVVHNFQKDATALTVNHFIWMQPDTGSAPAEKSGFESKPLETASVHPVEFQNFKTEGVDLSQPRNIDMLMDVEMEIYVELGKKTMLVKDILKLGKGSVVELEKAAGEPLGIFINGRKLAEGEVVVVDDHFGIRITQLAGTKERIKSLG